MSITIFEPFFHLVEYCETDAMRIVHHAEYIKWMEYSRHQFMLERGFDLAKMEKNYGIMIPILSVNVEYKSMTRFGDAVDVYVTLEKFNGIYMNFSYVMREHSTKEVKAMGYTKSGFIDKDYHPVILQHVCPEYYEKLERC